MKIEVKKDEIQKTLAKVQGIVEKRSTYPILSHILITASENETFMEATDLQIAIKEVFSAQVEGTGKVCIPAKKFYEIVRELPPENISIEEQENFWVTIKCGTISLRLPGLDPKDFPSFPEGKEGCLSIRGTLLKDMLDKVVFATSTQESAMNLHGVLFESIMREEVPYLRMVATDGHRLAIVEEQVEQVAQTIEFVVPRRGVTEVKKIFSDEIVDLRLGENVVQFKGEKSKIAVRLLEGQFPDYKHVLPKELEKKIIVDRKAFLSSLRRAEILASEKGEGVKISLSASLMEVQAGGGDVGEFLERLEVKYSAEPLSIFFNGRYLIEALNVIDTDFTVVELRDEESAGLIKPEGNGNYLYLVMPMKIG